MAITSGISFLGQTVAMGERLKDAQSKIDTLSRQMATQKKYDTMAGLGSDTQFVLQLHADLGEKCDSKISLMRRPISTASPAPTSDHSALLSSAVARSTRVCAWLLVK